jgi:hypothetical protein
MPSAKGTWRRQRLLWQRNTASQHVERHPDLVRSYPNRFCSSRLGSCAFPLRCGPARAVSSAQTALSWRSSQCRSPTYSPVSATQSATLSRLPRSQEHMTPPLAARPAPFRYAILLRQRTGRQSCVVVRRHAGSPLDGRSVGPTRCHISLERHPASAAPRRLSGLLS